MVDVQAETMQNSRYLSKLKGRAQGVAHLAGSEQYPNIRGLVQLYQTARGVLITAEFSGLPALGPEPMHPIFGFHLHEGESCGPGEGQPFAGALGHYNPKEETHPHHAGDLPPVFSNGGHAYQVFLTDRFTVPEVLGRALILHAGPDDFSADPSGHAGERIACGRIVAGDEW